MHSVSASAMKGVLQDIIKWCLQWNLCLEIPGPFHISICRPVQLKNDESQLSCMTKTQLGHCFVICCLAHGDEIGNERMDMINAPQAPECHITAELWLHLATCWGIQWDFACQRNRSRCSRFSKAGPPPPFHQILYCPLRWLLALAVRGILARCFS